MYSLNFKIPIVLLNNSTKMFWTTMTDQPKQEKPPIYTWQPNIWWVSSNKFLPTRPYKFRTEIMWPTERWGHRLCMWLPFQKYEEKKNDIFIIVFYIFTLT